MKSLIQNKKAQTQLVLLITIMASMFTLLHFAGVINVASIVGYDSVYKANYGSYCCFKTGVYSPDYKDTEKYLDDYGGTTKTCNYNTDLCNVKIVCDQNSIQTCSGGYIIDGISYTYSLPRNEEKVFDLSAGKTANFKTGIFVINEEHTVISLRTQPYSLIQRENGKPILYNTCILNSDLKRKTTTDGVSNVPFGQCQSYFLDFISVATKTYSYNNKEVICQLRKLYSIDNVKFLDGSTKKIQGNEIKSVECCPSEPNCNENTFVFVEDNVRECDYDVQCANGGDPYGVGQTTAREFYCDAGTCKSKDMQVECTSTSVCIARYGEGYVCDLSINNFGKCTQSSAPYVCGDGYCDIGETKVNCPSDCELECLEGEQLVITEKKVNCMIGYPINFACDTTTIKECKSSTTNYTLWIIIALVVVSLFFFKGQIFAITGTLLRKVGIRV